MQRLLFIVEHRPLASGIACRPSFRPLNGLTRMRIARLFPAKYGRNGALTWPRGKCSLSCYDSADASTSAVDVSATCPTRSRINCLINTRSTASHEYTYITIHSEIPAYIAIN